MIERAEPGLGLPVLYIGSGVSAISEDRRENNAIMHYLLARQERTKK